MRNIKYTILTLLSVLVLFSCEEKEKIQIDASKATPAAITSPSSIVLTEETADNSITFTWSEADFGVDLSITYRLEMDSAGTFADDDAIVTLYEGQALSYTTTVSLLNSAITGQLHFAPGVETTVHFRVVSSVSENYTEPVSAVDFKLTPFESTDFGTPIYILGDGTLIGWNNSTASQMVYLGEGEYETFVYLNATGYWKFVEVPGQWAPQWGQESGDASSGTLIRRPTDSDPDPSGISVPGTAGWYRIGVNLDDKTYTVALASTVTREYGLYMLGDGTLNGWSNPPGIPMNRDCEIQGDGTFAVASQVAFNVTDTLLATGGVKFIQVPGNWAPQWGYESDGVLAPRPTETVTDPPVIPVPGTYGAYTIRADINQNTYSID